MKNKNQDNEKLLFHGTAKISLNAINYNGFNRGFAGINGESFSKAVKRRCTQHPQISRADLILRDLGILSQVWLTFQPGLRGFMLDE